jgi:hypothetical protein
VVRYYYEIQPHRPQGQKHRYHARFLLPKTRLHRSVSNQLRINNNDGSLRIVYVHISDGQYLKLCLNGSNPRDFNDQTDLGVRHIYFTVEDIQKTYSLIKTPNSV